MNSGTDFGFFTPYPNSKYGSPCSAFVVFLFINRFDYVNHVRPFRNIHYYTVLCRIVPRMLDCFRGRWPVPIQNSDIAAPRPPTPISALVHSCPWQFPALVSFIPTKHTVQCSHQTKDPNESHAYTHTRDCKQLRGPTSVDPK